MIKDSATFDATMDKEKILVRNQNAMAFSLLPSSIDTSTPEGEFVFYKLEQLMDNDAKLSASDLPKARKALTAHFGRWMRYRQWNMRNTTSQ